ncbi:type II toxin-antitoxin system MqsR family toxin [Pseudomonas viridiflava]|uniref:type II toxin-antitoxin system MqsR family toxin n=1 Tax=Pseudomonas syringae group TaxID=136849 RepID=UPI00070CFCAE|nr:type II toxin-antitoxin system MqsR family toxin [Pseudomonas cannabina]MEE4156359.1 type II toxin-antitoxin system MqsR family toxin [Pseudomonas viridiflava]
MRPKKAAKTNVKYKPSYDLSELQKIVAKDPDNSFTGAALKTIAVAELSFDAAVELVSLIEPINFYKSMPCDDDSGWYQDVYYVPYQETVMYIKFTNYPHGKVVISFKER